MVVFWSIAALMTLAALGFVLVPLVREPRLAPGRSVADANLEVLRAQRREIEADAASGMLDARERDAALADLVDRTRGELALPAEAKPEAPTARRPWVSIAAAAVLVPAFSIGLYLA